MLNTEKVSLVRTRIKICGLTREEDVESALLAGVDALGFVFYSSSPRYVSPLRVRELISICPAWVCTVGLFVNSSRDEILRISDVSGINQIQLHGDESLEQCKNLYKPVVRALRLPKKKVSNKLDYDNLINQLIESKDYLNYCSAVLLDSASSEYGGSGQPFDWSILNDAGSIFGNKWVLSGGLNIKNITNAINSFKPPSIDISSGVEKVQNGVNVKGIKDKKKIEIFVNAVSKLNNKF